MYSWLAVAHPAVGQIVRTKTEFQYSAPWRARFFAKSWRPHGEPFLTLPSRLWTGNGGWRRDTPPRSYPGISFVYALESCSISIQLAVSFINVTRSPTSCSVHLWR